MQHITYLIYEIEKQSIKALQHNKQEKMKTLDVIKNRHGKLRRKELIKDLKTRKLNQ